jgi:hypothetical protein
MITEPDAGAEAPGNSPHGHSGGGDDAVEQAIHEVAEAKKEEAEATNELKDALRHEEQAEHKLEKAEAELEEARRHELIHFEVDGEPHETRQRRWTPNAIIKDFGGRDPANNYLIRIGHDEANYRDKGNIPIEIHECDRFQIIPTGAAPVSDGTKRTGIEAFVAGLKELGFDPAPLKDTTDRIFFDYKVSSGKFAGRQFRIGVAVPPDFPLTAPGGLHVSPRIHPNRGGNSVHPVEGIQDSPDFQKGAGGEWHYWSRPYKDWGKTKKTVAAYMNHVYRLWDTQ